MDKNLLSPTPKVESKQPLHTIEHGGTQAEAATNRLVEEALTKFHVSKTGSNIESVKQTATGYDISIAKGSQHESIKIGRDEIGSAMTLAVLGPDIYKSIHDQNAVGQRIATIAGGTMKGTFDAAKEEWTQNPAKAISDGALNMVTAAGLAVGAEALPVLSTIMGATLLGTTGAALVNRYPELAQKSHDLSKIWNQAGLVDGNTALAQANEVGGLVGKDTYQLGYTALTAAAGARGGWQLRPEVPGTIEPAIAKFAGQAAAQLGQAVMDALKDVPKMLDGSFQPAGLRMAFATAVGDLHVNRPETIGHPEFLKMSAHDPETAGPSRGDSHKSPVADPTRTAVKLSDQAVAFLKNANTPEEAFPGETGWKAYKSTSGPAYVRESSEVKSNGQSLHLIEHFVPGKVYSIVSKGAHEDFEVVYDIARQVETQTNNLARRQLGLPLSQFKLPASQIVEEKPLPPDTTHEGDGKFLPHNWLPPHPRR